MRGRLRWGQRHHLQPDAIQPIQRVLRRAGVNLPSGYVQSEGVGIERGAALGAADGDGGVVNAADRRRVRLRKGDQLQRVAIAIAELKGVGAPRQRLRATAADRGERVAG